MRRINEIFYSLQGEGRNAGMAAVFVRFAGCNLKCEFCDTDHAHGTAMTDEEIVAAVCRLPNAPLVVLTGGEPALQIDEQLVDKIKTATGALVAIETNGTLPLPGNLDWVTLSPKHDFTEAHTVIDHADELKVVYTGQSLQPYLDAFKARYYYLQPCATGDAATDEANVAATVEAVKTNPRWRLSLQTHKLIGIR